MHAARHRQRGRLRPRSGFNSKASPSLIYEPPPSPLQTDRPTDPFELLVYAASLPRARFIFWLFLVGPAESIKSDRTEVTKS